MVLQEIATLGGIVRILSSVAIHLMLVFSAQHALTSEAGDNSVAHGDQTSPAVDHASQLRAAIGCEAKELSTLQAYKCGLSHDIMPRLGGTGDLNCASAVDFYWTAFSGTPSNSGACERLLDLLYWRLCQEQIHGKLCGNLGASCQLPNMVKRLAQDCRSWPHWPTRQHDVRVVHGEATIWPIPKLRDVGGGFDKFEIKQALRVDDRSPGLCQISLMEHGQEQRLEVVCPNNQPRRSHLVSIHAENNRFRKPAPLEVTFLPESLPKHQRIAVGMIRDVGFTGSNNGIAARMGMHPAFTPTTIETFETLLKSIHSPTNLPLGIASTLDLVRWKEQWRKHSKSIVIEDRLFDEVLHVAVIKSTPQNGENQRFDQLAGQSILFLGADDSPGCDLLPRLFRVAALSGEPISTRCDSAVSMMGALEALASGDYGAIAFLSPFPSSDFVAAIRELELEKTVMLVDVDQNVQGTTRWNLAAGDYAGTVGQEWKTVASSALLFAWGFPNDSPRCIDLQEWVQDSRYFRPDGVLTPLGATREDRLDSVREMLGDLFWRIGECVEFRL